jgi:hypothetical protein
MKWGGLKPLEGYDPVYNGDYNKWMRFANSLKLRLAVRISNVSPELARTKAEEAVKSTRGLIDTNDNNAYVGVGAEPNPLWLVASSWGEIRINATIASYMKGYSDPRSAVYFTTSKPTECNRMLRTFICSQILVIIISRHFKKVFRSSFSSVEAPSFQAIVILVG